MKTYSLKKPILIPLMLAMTVLIGVFAVSSCRFQYRHMMREVASKLESVQKLFTGLLDSDAKMMGAALHSIVLDEQLKAACKAKDRKALLDLTLTLFGQLRAEHHITHFYLTDSDRINILRVHKPDKHSDEIDRFTTLAAERTGKLSYGMELGPLGTLTLRVVQPWYDGQELIGYVELGEEIEHITEKLHDIIGVEIYVLIEKRFLDRQDLETGMRMLGRDAQWDRFPTVVMIDQTREGFPEYLAEFLGEEHHTSMETDTEVSLNDRRYRSRFIHLNEASGRGVGDMVVMTDVTDLMADFHATVSLVVAICLAVTGALFILFYMFIGRVERHMAAASEEAPSSTHPYRC